MTSTMHVTVLFDESLGRGGSVVLALPDAIGLQRSSLNKPMKFNPSHQVTCRSDQRLLVSCSVSNSQELQLQLASDSFVLAGSSLSFTLKDACQNPSSLAFKDKSLAITTLDSSGRQVERKAEFLTLQSLSPAILQSAVVEYSSNALGKQGQVLTLLFRNVNPIPYQGKMELQIPRRPAG